MGTHTGRSSRGDARAAAGRWRWIGPFGFCVLVVVLVVRFGLRPGPGEAHQAAGPAGSADEGEGARAREGARVRGRVLLEVAPARPERPATDPGDGDPPAAGGVADEPTPDRVDLVAATSGSCTIRAWQAGAPLTEPVSCGDAGEFEVELPPGATGTAAFELTVPGRLRAVVETDLPGEGIGRLPPVALGVAQSIRGQVVDGHGVPVAGVTLEAMPSPNLAEPVPWHVETNSEGEFGFDTVPVGPIVVRADVAGYAPTVVEAIAPGDDLLVVLEQLVSLRGRVVGAPELVSRAVVLVEGTGVWPVRELEVGSDGAFVLPQIPAGTYALQAVVRSVGGTAPEYASVPLENVTPELKVTLALSPAHRVAVRVVEGTGTPVSGASVVVGNASIGLLQRVVTTDADGSARAGPLVPGPYVVRAAAAGYLPSEATAVLVASDATPAVELVLDREGRIAGEVVDELGRGVAGAQVLVEGDVVYSAGESAARARMVRPTLRPGGSLGVTEGPVPDIPQFDVGGGGGSDAAPVTGPDGRFVITGLRPGVYKLAAAHGRFAASASVAVTLGAGAERSDVKLVLRSGWRVSGRVRNDNGVPIAYARVELGAGETVLTDGAGVFDAGPQRGAVALVVRAPAMEPRRVRARVDGAPVDFEIELRPATGVFAGVVLDDRARALSGVPVTMSMLDGLSPTREAVTDARGRFAFDQLPMGRAELAIRHPTLLGVIESIRIEPRPGGPEQEFVLRAGWALDVFVAEARTREPVAGARVDAGGRAGVTGRDGTVRLAPLAVDRVSVRAEAPGFSSATARVRAESPAAQVELTLQPGGSLEGIVSDYRGDPVVGAHVVVHDAASDAALDRTRSGPGGRFRFDGLAEGDLVLRATPPPARANDLAAVAQAADVLAGHVTTDIDLRFDRR